MKPFTDLDLAGSFHGHIGPNLVIGIKLGNHALAALSPNCCFELTAEVFCPARPPLSCVIDGIQLATGCTMGKKNISHVISADGVTAVFTNKATGQTVSLHVSDDFIAQTLRWLDELGEEEASRMTWEAEDGVVFTAR